MLRLTTTIFILIIVSCDQEKTNSDKKILDFGSFTIETPKTWNKLNLQGIDSYRGRIVIDDNDTLSFDLGWYSNKLYETDLTILDSSMISSIDTNIFDVASIVFVKDRSLVDPDKYRKNNVSWDTVDGYKAKIVYPRHSGVGITGIYIDSLWKAGHSITHFNLYGTDLKPENEATVLEAIKTLKFKKK